ncbi:EpsG family protein, partial [Chryseobacterium sp. 09-1422]
MIENADYNTYLRFVDTGELSELSFGSLFSEPYFFIVVLSIKNMVGDTAGSLNFYYIINFIISTIFFIWIIRLKDIQTFSKVLLFSLYYFLFAYTTVRNSPAYILVGVLYYFLHRKKIFKLGYLSFLAHLSSVPAVLFSLFRVDKVSKKVLIGSVIMFPLFFILINLPFLNLSDKLTQYEESTEYGVSTFHKIYFIVMILMTIFLYFKNKALVYNNVYILNFVMYMLLYSISGVM